MRAVWSEETQRWYFSVLDVIGAFNQQEDYEKNRNYWKYLKAKLKKEGSELVSATTQLKLRAADGKLYNTDVMDMDAIRKLAFSFPNTKALTFIDWLTSNDNSIDGQSRIFKKNLRKCVDWSLIEKKKYLAAMGDSMTDACAIKNLLRESLTGDITSREMFMKGGDYSYYYEQEE
ncbi:MAG: hypothetical protein MJZ14_07110 [Paludibacteraceae bacterium]|nr:hypothetical protein [Paludibacteraceae bacterium]